LPGQRSLCFSTVLSKRTNQGGSAGQSAKLPRRKDLLVCAYLSNTRMNGLTHRQLCGYKHPTRRSWNHERGGREKPQPSEEDEGTNEKGSTSSKRVKIGPGSEWKQGETQSCGSSDITLPRDFQPWGIPGVESSWNPSRAEGGFKKKNARS